MLTVKVKQWLDGEGFECTSTIDPCYGSTAADAAEYVAEYAAEMAPLPRGRDYLFVFIGQDDATVAEIWLKELQTEN